MELIKDHKFLHSIFTGGIPKCKVAFFPTKWDIQYSIHQLVFTKTHVICIPVSRPLSRHKYVVIKMQVDPERPSTRCFTFIS